MAGANTDREKGAAEIAIEPRKARAFGMDVLDQLEVPREKGIVRQKSSTLLIDGCSGPGPVTALQSMKDAMRLCRENGVGGCLPTIVTTSALLHSMDFRPSGRIS